ncbi:MAG: M48 family metalloprotease [Rhodospirillales bacterium]
MRSGRCCTTALAAVLAAGMLGGCMMATRSAGTTVDTGHSAARFAGEGAAAPEGPSVTQIALADGIDFSYETEMDPFKYHDIRPAERPALDTDEAGNWLIFDRMEESAKSAGNRITDESLNAYVGDVICRLAGPYCPDIRYYVLRIPGFNASMASNGMMNIRTGFLLRARNEAQFAAVLGHEIAHYLRRHGIQRFQNVRARNDFMQIFRIGVTAGATFGGVVVPAEAVDLTALLTEGAVRAYSRDHEREADLVGLLLMHQAGYDPHEAAAAWKNLIAEMGGDGGGGDFLDTHPAPKDRAEYLDQIAATMQARQPANRKGVEEYRRQIDPFLPMMLRDEINHGNPKHTLKLLDMLKEDGADAAVVTYFQGEVFRLRGTLDEDGEWVASTDLNAALEKYIEAIELGEPPNELHRNMGTILEKLEEPELARKAYARYLERAPGAVDAEVIRAMMEAL